MLQTFELPVSRVVSPARLGGAQEPLGQRRLNHLGLLESESIHILREAVADYAETRHIPQLPQYAGGYLSSGCQPCTAIPADPGNPRSGRWGGQKLECGIHIFSTRRE